MAAGSSSPELFTAITSLLLVKLQAAWTSSSAWVCFVVTEPSCANELISMICEVASFGTRFASFKFRGNGEPSHFTE